MSSVGIPIGVNTSNIKLSREFELPKRMRINDWQVMRDGGKNRSRKFMALPYTTNNLSITGPEQVKWKYVKLILHGSILFSKYFKNTNSRNYRIFYYLTGECVSRST